MSNYKLIEVSKNNTGQESQSLYDFDDLSAAYTAMYNDFGVMMKDATVVSAYCLAIDNETGERMDKRYFEDASSAPVDEEQEAVDTAIRARVYTHNDYADDNIAAYDSERLAQGNYYTKHASSMGKASCNFAITICIDGKGEFLEFSKFER